MRIAMALADNMNEGFDHATAFQKLHDLSHFFRADE
jgi:hypothetical protein